MKSYSNKCPLLLSLSIFLLLITTSTAYSATYTWLGTNGNWHTASNWDLGSVPNFGDKVIVPSGYLTIDNNAKCEEIEILASASIEILSIGGLYIQGLPIQDGINNFGSLTNHGKVSIASTAKAIKNNTGATMRNYGSITITDGVSYGISCFSNSGTFINYASASIIMNDINDGASVIGNYGSSARFTNKGAIDISNCYGIASAIIVADGLLFLNDKNSSMTITDVGTMGIRVYGTFRNKGNIDISNLTINSSIGVYGFMVNHQKGNIIIDEVEAGVVVFDNSSFYNYGLLNQTNEGGFAFDIRGVFANRPMGTSISSRSIYVSPTGSLASQGHLISNYDGQIGAPHFIAGICNNVGVFGDVNDEMSNTNLNNQSIIVRPWNSTVQVGVPFPNALEVGTNDYTTILSWYTSSTSNTVAGTYNTSTNTFTPNSNAEGLTSVWVKIKINQGNRKRRHEIKIPGGIQPPASSYVGMDANATPWNAPLIANGKPTIYLYPNPVANTLNVDLGNDPTPSSQLYLINALGKQIMSKSLTNRENNIDLSRLNNGAYWLIIKEGNKIIEKRQIIKQ